jgi:hypothetical protein
MGTGRGHTPRQPRRPPMAGGANREGSPKRDRQAASSPNARRPEVGRRRLPDDLLGSYFLG